ncbi:solute carrier family 2, facilitated glucose transporter member 3-like isoform X1 [Octopus sinensis]|uniref:Solute carrier family 2, facilitated glucose transporter member 3-like isoform X1 n=1 Tax=Octopus sinensis TaxID=2607531 RepID=A0A7E6FPN5_9MOLL|nr:solute carrier family 2, facilitated glucose transporter member 3-like isoform X1 [Octopus sinensis]
MEEEGRPKSQEEPKRESKEEPKEEVKEESKKEPKEESKEETKEKPKEESKGESKEESKKESKGESKEESKKESKEEPKEEPKEESKEGLKEQENNSNKPNQDVENFELSKMEKKSSGLTPYLAFCTFVAVFGNSLLYGYNIGVINTPAEIIMDFYNETYAERSDSAPSKEFITMQWSLTVSLFVAFGMIGSFVSGMMADRFGRKKSMLLITVIMFLAAITGGITKTAKAPECLMISRMLVGLHSGVNIGLASLYLAEIAPKEIRGAVGTCHQLAITIGILLAQILGLEELMGTPDLWPMLFAFVAFPTLVTLVLLPFCPESPRYLAVKKQQIPEAEAALRKLRGVSDVSDEVEEMRLEASKSVEKPFKVKELLVSPVHRIPILVACLMMVFQQWSGINAVFAYSQFIFTQAQLDQKAIPYAIVGTGVTNVFATIIVIPLMEKLGRRPLLLSPTAIMALAMLILSIFLNIQEGYEDEKAPSWMGYVSIIIMLVYIIGFAVGLGPIPFNIVSELFTQGPRAAAMSMSLVFNWVTNFILLLTFPFLQLSMGPYTFILFIVVLIVAVFFIFFFVPETKGKTFEEIQRILAAGKVWKKHTPLPADEVVGENVPMDTTKV